MDVKKHDTILVVDDDPSARSFISTLLDKYGYPAVVCETGKEALSKLQTNKIDIVLTDIMMPEMSGMELLENIRNSNPEVPVILITGHADFGIAVDAIKKGVFDFILKPYSPAQIIHSVEKASKYRRLSEMEKNYKHLLEEFNQEVETLIAERTMNLMALTVADRVRNPATVIGCIGKKMIERKDISEDFKENLKNIIGETEKLQTIVSDFHNLLKSKESKFKYEDINEIVEGVFSSVETKDIELYIELSEQPLKINMQKNLLRVAIYLLMRNSIEAISGQGKIWVKTYRDKDNVILTISDNGCGMPQELINKIFDPFFSTKKQRFGMGLPLVKQIVSEHLGEIKVESEVSKGTTFHLIFPSRWT
ncbi:MAG: hybrid sensor histidine kinase/response regulator [Nitrospirota bacterium]